LDEVVSRFRKYSEEQVSKQDRLHREVLEKDVKIKSLQDQLDYRDDDMEDKDDEFEEEKQILLTRLDEAEKMLQVELEKKRKFAERFLELQELYMNQKEEIEMLRSGINKPFSPEIQSSIEEQDAELRKIFPSLVWETKLSQSST